MFPLRFPGSSSYDNDISKAMLSIQPLGMTFWVTPSRLSLYLNVINNTMLAQNTQLVFTVVPVCDSPLNQNIASFVYCSTLAVE